ncbi:MAG TPA: hypothetical protein PLE74_03625 [Candidatus Cloacimonadota bacterium]|nr:hypothetical protein [Candidatus Cloacimonadota bacterium]HPT71349.1 hypothetical protein [Candidatus Cloacimonadota bacterium]
MKPILFGVAILLLSTCLQGVVYQWNDSSLQYLLSSGNGNSNAKEDDSGESEGGTWSASTMHQAEVAITKALSAFFQTDFYWEDQNPHRMMTSLSVPASFYKNWRVSGTYNRFQGKLEYSDNEVYGKIQYRNQWFASDRTNPNYIFIKSNPSLPFWAPENGAHRPELIQDVYTQGKLNTVIGSFDLGGRVRISNYNLAFWDTLGVLNQNNTERQEYFMTVQSKINTLPHFYLLMNLSSKNDNTDSYYNMTQYGLALAFENKFDFFHMLDASVQYDRMNSHAYSNEKDNYFTSQMRYTHRIGNNFTAFLSYINRTVYSEDEQSMLLISNALRVQARYSLNNDINGDAYVICGGKYSPEQKTSVAFAEFNYPVIQNLYVNVNDKYSPTYVYESHDLKDVRHENEAGIGFNYYFTPWQLVYVSDLFSTINAKGISSSNQHLITLGAKLVF